MDSSKMCGAAARLQQLNQQFEPQHAAQAQQVEVDGKEYLEVIDF